MKHFALYLYLIAGITLAVLYIPFFILLNQQDSSYERIYDGVSLEGSSISDVIKNSNILILAQTCIIVGILPMILDIIMDSQVLNKLPDLWGDRCMIVVILIVPSLTYLIFRKSSFMPFLYVIQFLSQNMLYPTVMIHSVYKDILAVSPIVVPSLCLLALALFGVRCVFEAYVTLLKFDDTPYRMAGSNIFMVLSWTVAFQKIVPVLAFLITAIACLITNSVFHATTWSNVSEEILVSYAFIQLVYTVFMTVLPGRVARLDAEMRMEDLTLKGIFVRFISHEIRSPLNVVVSGLDFLKDEVKVLDSSVRDKLEDLLNEMTVASASAADTLTDVLDYELIDAGTLKLDLSWSPLAQFFEDKFKWAEIVASTKQVTLAIVDNTVSTAAGIRTLRGRTSRDSSAVMELAVRDIEEGYATSSLFVRRTQGEHVRQLSPWTRSFLHVDASKIMQFLRNVVTNAINHSPVGGTVSIKLDYIPTDLSTPIEGVVGMLRIEVRDSGKGFAAEEQEQIAADLLRFNGRDLKGEGNVGLGMWIAHGIVKLHQGSFNLYSDGIQHGCRLVAELPLYSYPTTLLTVEDQIQFSSIFRTLQEHYDDEEEGSGIGVAGAEGLVVTDDVMPFNNFVVDESPEIVGSTPQLPFAEIENGTVGTISKLSQFQDIPFLEDLSDQAPVPVIPAVPEKEKLHSTSKATHTSYSSHCKVFPDAATDSLDDRNESKSSDLKAKPPSDRVVVAAGDSAGKGSDGLRFLIVDDSALNRKIIRRILENERSRFSNAVIEEADDGTTAVSAVERAAQAGLTFDFIFMDFVMITMNGPEAVKILRNDLQFRHTIIGVTGNALPADIALFLARGADQVLLKPLNKAQFMTALLSFIDRE